MSDLGAIAIVASNIIAGGFGVVQEGIKCHSANVTVCGAVTAGKHLSTAYLVGGGFVMVGLIFAGIGFYYYIYGKGQPPGGGGGPVDDNLNHPIIPIPDAAIIRQGD